MLKHKIQGVSPKKRAFLCHANAKPALKLAGKSVFDQATFQTNTLHER